MDAKKKVQKVIGAAVNAVTNRVSQTSVSKGGEPLPPTDEMKKLCRAAAAESFVLLKNDGGILPLSKEKPTALFGRLQFDPFSVGYGSGGDVNAHYRTNLNAALHKAGVPLAPAPEEALRRWRKKNKPDDGYWGHWPTCREEMPLTEYGVREAAEQSGTAVYMIGRAAGEDRENSLTPGSYYLTETEERNLKLLRRYFPRLCVLLNVGSLMDLSFIETMDIPVAGVCWLGGMEGGNALADVLTGAVCPGGRLTDTVARSYEAYPSAGNFGGKRKNLYEEDIYVGYRYFETFAPEDVLFPFGYGLSFTEFTVGDVRFTRESDAVRVACRVKNTGPATGRHTLQLYYTCAGGPLDTPARTLCAFGKTDPLAPGEETDVTLCVKSSRLGSYDETGVSGFRDAWVLQKGKYRFFFGADVRSAALAGSFTQEKTVLLRQCRSVLPPRKEERLMCLTAIEDSGAYRRSYRPASAGSETPLRERILAALPAAYTDTAEKPLTLRDVKADPALFDSLIAQLTDEELEAITRGDYTMNSPLGPRGNAGVFGGVTESLREKGLAPVVTTDGPSGIRIGAPAALLPCGAALASTWDPPLIERLYEAVGAEMKERGSDVLLAPGMNIHRDPLCGRNFEYFSEDPLISGMAAAAVIKGLEQAGVSGCPKHFACNNQETNRTKNNSVVSMRALREIYLRGFEICVKAAAPAVLMTSYNKINGVWGHYNYPLVTEILRGEWGFDGVVITDWWMQSASSPEFPSLRDQAYRVRAGVDVLMPGGGRAGKREPDGTLLETLGARDGITKAELQRAAAHVIRFMLRCGHITEEDKAEPPSEAPPEEASKAITDAGNAL